VEVFFRIDGPNGKTAPGSVRLSPDTSISEFVKAVMRDYENPLAGWGVPVTEWEVYEGTRIGKQIMKVLSSFFFCLCLVGTLSIELLSDTSLPET